jgi:ATP-dependent Lhr-like helicase
MEAATLAERYCFRQDAAEKILHMLAESGTAVYENGWYYHADLYEYARRETINARRRQIITRPPQVYAAYMASRLQASASPAEQLATALTALNGRAFPPQMWESVILPARVSNYRGAMLDNLLAGGDWFWRLALENGAYSLSFHPSGEIDWDAVVAVIAGPNADNNTPLQNGPSLTKSDGSGQLNDAEQKIYSLLLKRGASFMAALEDGSGDIPALLMSLAEKGLARSDSFVPIRQWLERDKTERAAVKQKVRARVLAQTSGRWEICRPLKPLSLEQQLERAFSQVTVLCKETAALVNLSWPLALSKLRAWEYTGQARRGYFIEGMSGAQFIHEKDFTGAMLAFETLDERKEAEAGEDAQTESITRGTAPVYWLAATDPLQPWGRLLAHPAGRAFMCVQGTAVALRGGLPVALFEKNGAVLKIFDENNLHGTLKDFIKAYTGKKIFPDKKRITVKQYPPGAEAALNEAGFKRVMMDYVAYQS